MSDAANWVRGTYLALIDEVIRHPHATVWVAAALVALALWF